MKKKLCIFLIIMIAFFANKAVVNAAVNSPTDSLKTMCDMICYSFNTNYYTNDYMDECYRDCALQPKYNYDKGKYYKEVDESCYMADGTSSLTQNTIKCYGTLLCKKYGLGNSNWCKTHDNGQKAGLHSEDYDGAGLYGLKDASKNNDKPISVPAAKTNRDGDPNGLQYQMALRADLNAKTKVTDKTPRITYAISATPIKDNK